jgi:hypothetical protein
MRRSSPSHYATSSSLYCISHDISVFAALGEKSFLSQYNGGTGLIISIYHDCTNFSDSKKAPAKESIAVHTLVLHFFLCLSSATGSDES